MLYFIAVSLPKLSMLVLYHRIFVGRKEKWIIWGLIIAQACWAVGGLISSVLMCHPLSIFWTVANPKGTGACIDITNFYKYGAIPNMVTDIFITFLPVPAIWGLNVSGKTRATVFCVLLAGSL